MKAINNGKKNLNLHSGRCKKNATCEVLPAEMMNMRDYFIQAEMPDFAPEVVETHFEEPRVIETSLDDVIDKIDDPASELLDEYGYLKGHPLWDEYSNTEKGRLNKLRSNNE